MFQKENKDMPFGWAMFCLGFLLVSMIGSVVVELNIPTHINLLASISITLLVAWLNGKPCVFTSDRTGSKVEIPIGQDREALYYFLVFCKRIAEQKEISEDFRDYLGVVITRSCNNNEACEACLMVESIAEPCKIK